MKAAFWMAPRNMKLLELVEPTRSWPAGPDFQIMRQSRMPRAIDQLL
jgi:hypothetical protein